MRSEIRPEIRREAISLLLGDLRDFPDYTQNLHLYSEQTNHLLDAISARVEKLKLEKGVIRSEKIKVEIAIREAKNFVQLLLKFISQQYFNSSLLPQWRVNYRNWEDWLQTCWGLDHDTLSMLSILSTSTNLENLVEYVKKLPVIPLPVIQRASEKSDRRVMFDYHIHSDALYPPSLQWAHLINTGINNYKEFFSNKRYEPQNLSGYQLNQNKIKEHRERSRLADEYLTVARVLLGAMLDFYEISNRSDQTISSENNSSERELHKCSDLVNKVINMVNTDVDRKELGSLLKSYLPELNNSSSEYLTKAVETGNQFQEEVSLFFKEERKCIAYLLWKAYHQKNQLGIFIQEVLFTYLRCKGAWFQINSGSNLKELNLFEHLLLKNDDFSNVDTSKKPQNNQRYFKIFHTPMSEVVKQFYLDTKYPKRVQVRLPFMHGEDIPQKMQLLTSIYKKVDLVLSFPRFNFEHNNEKLKHREEAYINFINRFIENNDSDKKNKDYRVCGVDLVGTNESIDWKYYGELILKMRKKICPCQQKKSCFVTYHLDEKNNVFSLNEICEILTILKESKLRKNDRISHAWSLLSKADQFNHTATISMHKKEWELIELRLDELKDNLTDEQKKIVDKLHEKGQIKDEYAELNAKDMSELADSLQPLVQKELIKTGILLEVCPTSSWRIAGIPLPTKHPVNSWIKAGGKVLVGTDNPGVFPCTIESENYALQRIMEQSNMTEATSQPTFDVFLAHNSDDKEQVEYISNQLQSRGLNPYLDVDQIQPGRTFQDEIQTEISRVKSAAIFIGSHGLGKWEKVEWRSLMTQFVNRNIPLIPVLLPGVHNFDNLPINLLFLQEFRWVSFSNDKNPLDLLEWGITGKKPNTIEQNEKPGRFPTQEDIQTILPSTNKVSGGGRCSCVDELGKLDKAGLRKRLEKRLRPENIMNIWYDTFEEKINKPTQAKIDQCVIDLIEQAYQYRRVKRLIENLCHQRHDLAEP